MTDTVIFDLDGTLLDTLEDLTDSVNHAMETFGFPRHTIDEVRTFVGNGAPKLLERSIPQGLENPDYEAALAAFKAHYAAHCEDKTKPYEGVPEMLAALKAQGYHPIPCTGRFVNLGVTPPAQSTWEIPRWISRRRKMRRCHVSV